MQKNLEFQFIPLTVLTNEEITMIEQYVNQEETVKQFLEEHGCTHPTFAQTKELPLLWVVPEIWEENFAHFPEVHGFSPAFMHIPRFDNPQQRSSSHMCMYLSVDIDYYSLDGKTPQKHMSKNIDRPSGYFARFEHLYVISEKMRELL